MDVGVFLSLMMFVVFIAMILIGYNVAFSFAATALLFSFIGDLTGTFNPASLGTLPARWFGAVSDPTLLAVSANYDGRRFEGVVEPVRGVCAGRYDGSGGFDGFAFAARGDFLDSGYRFPEELTWWWGDNHLLATIEQAGGWYGIAKHATCVHLDGGSVTSRTLDQEEFAQQCENDRQTFRRLMGLDEDDQPGMPAEDSQMVLPAPSEQR